MTICRTTNSTNSYMMRSPACTPSWQTMPASMYSTPIPKDLTSEKPSRMPVFIYPDAASGRSSRWCWDAPPISGSTSRCSTDGRRKESTNGTPDGRNPLYGSLTSLGKNADHPTMKPIPLLAYPLLNSSMTGCTVLDPFWRQRLNAAGLRTDEATLLYGGAG